VRLAAGALAVAAALSPAAAATTPHPAPAKALSALVIVSGTPQTAPAYAAPATSQYVVDFPQALVVRLDRSAAKVRFTCPATHCKLRVADENDDPGHRVDASNYEEVIKNHTSTLKMGLAVDLPGHYQVYAQTVDADDTLTGPKTPPFELTAQ
jgi:hypothetical protein